MKKIMVIAGGYGQIELIKKAKEMGHYVICSNLYVDSPAFPYADACEVSDVLDKEKNLEIAQKYKPDAVITDQSDIAIPTVAYVNEKMKLNGIGLEKANLFTNKYKMREFCREYDFDCPDFMLCKTLNEAQYFLSKYKKIVIKPIDNQASRGIFTISNLKQLQDKFGETMSYSTNEQAVLVEEYIDGIEFTVDGVMCNKKHYSLAVSEKKHYEESPNVASELFFSHKNEYVNYDILREQNNLLVQQMGLDFGLTHAEYILHNGRFYLVEITARGGGTNISGIIVPFISGIDTNKLLIRMALGENVLQDIKEHLSFNKSVCAILEFFKFKPGKVNNIYGDTFLQNESKILDYKFNINKGDWIVEPQNDAKRPGYYIAWENDYQKLRKLQYEIKNNVSIEYS